MIKLDLITKSKTEVKMEKRDNCIGSIYLLEKDKKEDIEVSLSSLLLNSISESHYLFHNKMHSMNISSIRRIYTKISALELLLFFRNPQKYTEEMKFKVNNLLELTFKQLYLNLPNKDIVSIKIGTLPEITLFRNYHESENSFLVICNCQYKYICNNEPRFFDLILHIENQASNTNSKNFGCQLTVISKKSLNPTNEHGKKTRITNVFVPNYGIFYLIFSFIIYLYDQILSIIDFLTSKFLVDALDVDKEFIKHLLKNLEALGVN